MVRKIALGVLIAAVAICACAYLLHRKTVSNLDKWDSFSRTTKELVGHKREDADRTMRSMDMRLRSTVRTQSDWPRAADHVSPDPPRRVSREVLKYTDQAMLTRKCAFLYIGDDDCVSSVHLATEYW